MENAVFPLAPHEEPRATVLFHFSEIKLPLERELHQDS